MVYNDTSGNNYIVERNSHNGQTKDNDQGSGQRRK